MLNLVVLAAILAASPAAGPVQPPGILFREPTFPRPGPVWVSLDEALGPDGAVRNELFSPTGRRLVAHQIVRETFAVSPDAPVPDCTRGSSSTDIYPTTGAESSFDSLSTHAAAIYSGTVSAESVGFLDGHLGTLLQIDAPEALKGEPRPTPIYVFYPYANARRGALSICRIDWQYRLRPQPGNRLLLFAFRPGLDADHVLFQPGPRHVMLEGGNGELVLDPSFKDENAPKAFGDGIDRVRRLVRTVGAR